MLDKFFHGFNYFVNNLSVILNYRENMQKLI